MMMGYGGFLGGLLAIFMVLSFAYIVWVLALKETGYIKTTGLVFSCGIAILVLLVVLYAGLGGQCMMGGKGMMHERMEKQMDKMSK